MVDVSRRYPSACYESSHEKWLLFLNYAIVATPESGGYAYLVILTPELIANTVYWISYTGLPSPFPPLPSLHA